MGKNDTLAFNSHVFHEGTMTRGYEFFGTHAEERDGQRGYVFRTWAPHAREISIVGDFNGWQVGANPMQCVEREIWEGFVPGLKEYDTYKFAVMGQNGEIHMKADPYASTPKPAPERLPKSMISRATNGMTPTLRPIAASIRSAKRRPIFTRCIWVPGGATKTATP